MKTIYREVSYPAFPYCQKHNRLFPHYTVGWLTPARPHELPTFQALCDECRKEAVCALVLSLPSKSVLAAKAS
jgi:hypothetical protein